MTDKKGWFKQPQEHALASKGIPTKQKEVRTPVSTDLVVDANTTTERPETQQTLVKEQDRIIQLFADRNYKYELHADVNNKGIYLTADAAKRFIRVALPNGIGNFNSERIEQLSESHSNPRFYIQRDEHGAIIITVSGKPKTHPGVIRDWVDATVVAVDEDDRHVYKWSPDTKLDKKEPIDTTKLKTDDALIEWAEQTKTGQTDSSFSEWVKEGEE